jgi:hypothetical protein
MQLLLNGMSHISTRFGEQSHFLANRMKNLFWKNMYMYSDAAVIHKSVWELKELSEVDSVTMLNNDNHLDDIWQMKGC